MSTTTRRRPDPALDTAAPPSFTVRTFAPAPAGWCVWYVEVDTERPGPVRWQPLAGWLTGADGAIEPVVFALDGTHSNPTAAPEFLALTAPGDPAVRDAVAGELARRQCDGGPVDMSGVESAVSAAEDATGNAVHVASAVEAAGRRHLPHDHEGGVEELSARAAATQLLACECRGDQPVCFHHGAPPPARDTSG